MAMERRKPAHALLLTELSSATTSYTNNDVDPNDVGIIAPSDDVDADDVNLDIILAAHGYNKLCKMGNTLQGQLYKAKKLQCVDASNSSSDLVAIKQISKQLYNAHIAYQDNCTFCVDNDVVKEAYLLQLLTEHRMIGDYVVRFVEFFESKSHLFLVMEYVDSTLTLKQYIARSHQLIADGKLSRREYSKAVKFIMWQLVTTIYSLHDMFQCAHLDLCPENIVLLNAEYVKAADGSLKVDNAISIKLCDFGKAEMFKVDHTKSNMFECAKSALSIDNGLYAAPAVYSGDSYDARAADMWSLGIILSQLILEQPLYVAADLWTEPKRGYLAIMNNELKCFLDEQDAVHYFDKYSLSLLSALLQFDENDRITASGAIKHAWFARYYNAYKTRINKKKFSTLCTLQNLTETGKLNQFPFYR